MELGHYGWNKNVNFYQSHAVFINNTAPATSNYGVFNVGDGPFDGVSVGKFIGNINGTIIAANAASGFSGNLIDLQAAGSVSVFKVDASGNVTAPNIAYINQFNIFTHNQTINSVDTSGTLLTLHQPSSSIGFALAAQFGLATIFSINAGTSTFNTDFNIGGNSALSGTLAMASAPAASGNTALVMMGNGGFAGGQPNFVGASGGTYIGINATSFTGNFFSCEIDGTTFFSVGANGKITSVSNSQWSINQNATLGTNNDFFIIDNAGGNGALTGGTGNQQSFVTIRPNINQTSTAGYTGLEVNVTETTTGSGTNLLLNLQVGGVNKFSVSNTGTLTLAGTLPATALTGVVPAASLTNAKGQMHVFIPAFGIRNGPVFDGLLLGSFPLTAVGSCRKALTGGTAFTDLTSAANNATTSDVTFNFGATNDAFYIGHATLKFTTIKIKYTTASVYSATLVWEYWNGSTWGTLLTSTPTFLADSTATFPATNSLKAAAGSFFITFQPPSDWASTTVNAVAGFYVRLRVSAFTSLSTGIAADQIWLYTVTSGSGISAGQHGNITRIDWNASALSVSANDSKFLIINGTTGSMYLFTATKGTQNVVDTSINLAVSETDQILVQQIQNSAAAFVESGGFANVNLTLTITPT